MKSLVTKIFDTVALTGGVPHELTSDTVTSQRKHSRLGQVLFTFDGNPNVTVGLLTMYGRLTPDQPFTRVFKAGTLVQTDASAYFTFGKGFAHTSIPLLPQFRFYTDDLQPTTSRNFDGWVLE